MKEGDDRMTRVLVQNIKIAMAGKDWTQTRLAERLGCDRLKLHKILKCKQCMPATLLIKIARVLGERLDTLVGLQPPHAQQELIPWHQAPTAMLARFAEHEEHAEDFVTYDRFPACPRMTETVQTRVNLFRFGKSSRTATGQAAFEANETWGQERRARYLQRDRESLPQITTFMRKSDFELLVHRQPPFRFCKPEQVAECLQYLKHRCVIERGFRLILIEDKRIDSRPDLAAQLAAVEALGVIGRNFVFRKLHDSSVFASEKADAVRIARQILNRLLALADHGGEKKHIIQQLDSYQRGIERDPNKATSPKGQTGRFLSAGAL